MPGKHAGADLDAEGEGGQRSHLSGPRPGGGPRGWPALAVLASAALIGLAAAATAASERALSSRLAERAARVGEFPGRPPRPSRLWARPLAGPPKVGLQVGHWRMEELPEELARLRENTGAVAGGVREVEINLAVAHRAAELLRAEGVQVHLLPGTIPPEYLADAVVAIHADGAWRPGARGWKVASAWRASQASRRLERELAREYAAHTGLPEDRLGTTYNMKGYYAFSAHRFAHAVSPFTPSVIIETGFITDPEDRAVLLERTDDVARGIASGILRFLAGHASMDWKSLAPSLPAAARVGAAAVELRAFPDPRAPARRLLAPGLPLLVVSRESGWVEVIVRGDFRSFGWMPESALEVQ